MQRNTRRNQIHDKKSSHEYILSILKKRIATRDRQDHATTNANNSWKGSEAVSIIATHNDMKRSVAVTIGQMLLDEGHFHAVNGSASFEDGPALYRFKENKPSLLPMRSFDMLSNALSWLFTASEENVKHALSLACQRNDGKQVRKILEDHGLDVNSDLNDHGWTALHIAAKHGAVDVMSVLLNEFNADVDADTANVPDVGDAFTPLMVGAVNGRLAVVSLLCEQFNGDHLITNDRGETAMELARAHGHKTIYRYLGNLLEFSSGGRGRTTSQSRHGSLSVERAQQIALPRQMPSKQFSGGITPPTRTRRGSSTLTPDWGRRTSVSLLYDLEDIDDEDSDEKVAEGAELSKSAEKLESVIATQEQELRQLRSLLRQRSRDYDELQSHLDTLETRMNRQEFATSKSDRKEVGIDYFDDDIDSDVDLE